MAKVLASNVQTKSINKDDVFAQKDPKFVSNYLAKLKLKKLKQKVGPDRENVEQADDSFKRYLKVDNSVEAGLWDFSDSSQFTFDVNKVNHESHVMLTFNVVGFYDDIFK